MKCDNCGAEIGQRKADLYLKRYGKFKAFLEFGGRGDSVDDGVQKMRKFYSKYPEFPA